MKKALLVGAILSAFAAQAHAESSVTLYGLVDAGYSFSKEKVTTTTANGSVTSKTRNLGLENGIAGGSYWGLQGSEDLGNGTSAIFGLESGFDTTDGSSDEEGTLFNNNAFVGLSGESWGTLTIGRQGNVADEFMDEVDPFGTDFGQAGAGSVFNAALSADYQKSIKYMSPDFNGFQFGAAVSHEYSKVEKTGSDTSKTGATSISLGLKYSTDKLFLGATYDTTKDREEGSQRVHAWTVGGSYDFDVVKLHAAFGQQRNGMWGDDGVFALAPFNEEMTDENDEPMRQPWNSKGYRQNSWVVGLSAPVGDAGTVMFSYQGYKAKNNKVDLEIGKTPIKAHGHIFSLGYTYDLSKRTTVYGVASYGEAKLKQYDALGDLDSRTKTKSTYVAIGLKHAF